MKKAMYFVVTAVLFLGCGTSKQQATSVTEPVVEEFIIESSDATRGITKEIEVIEQPIYRASETIHTDLIHTKLEVSFNWEKAQMNGKATLTLSPRFYPTDSLFLDAQSMDITSVSLGNKPLKYTYADAKSLRIQLDKVYTRNEEYSVEITYIAKPEEKETSTSSPISSNKGLYFINPKGENKFQMPQIWTQGEPVSNSVWFPTIDQPNIKTTQEIFITVEDKYKTLSNGRLVSSKKNNDGTRTDYWKQDLAHAPYLFMMAIGEFSIVEDTYTKADGTVIPVYYYVEPEWEEHARSIFGKTPEMMRFFSELLGVEYPWEKYHQIVVRDFVSGAMENTSASVFGDFVYRTAREQHHADAQAIIAHELFHHWFGNLVTLESWANLPLNESFANYSQYLWDEYHKGRDEADYNAENEKNGYYQTAASSGHYDMIRYDYNDIEDMFDAHSYNKGGRILHMLRYYLGDEAFFEGLRLYLTENAFGTAELANLRMSFEKISGEDLNWFFNQWFLASHHPELKITQTLEENQVRVRIEQKQDLDKAPLYILPLKIGVYTNDNKVSYDVVVDKNINEFVFPIQGELQNIVVDEDRVILGAFTHDKPREWYVHQYYNAPRYLDRKEAINYGSRLHNEIGKQLIVDALQDDFWHIRQLAVEKLDILGEKRKDEIHNHLINIIKNDKNAKVRASAINMLSNRFMSSDYKNSTQEILINAIEVDSSYLVVARALEGLTKAGEAGVQQALTFAEKLEKEPSSSLKTQIFSLYNNHKAESKIEFMSHTLLSGDITSYDVIGAMMNFSSYYGGLDIEVQEKYFYVLTLLSKSQNAYVSSVYAFSIVNILQSIESRIEKLESELETNPSTKNQDDLNRNFVFLDKLRGLLM